MTDDELVRAFESTALPASDFTHEAHVHVAWWYLRTSPFHSALARFATALRAFAAAKGAANKYHETMTVFWMALVAERLDATPDLEWRAFVAAHPDLFARQLTLARYYSDALLMSERARRTFVLPDVVREAAAGAV